MLTIDNYAPNADAITLRDDDLNISITQDEHGKVHIVIQESDWRTRKDRIRHIILGRKKVDSWPNIQKVNRMSYRMPKEEVGE